MSQPINNSIRSAALTLGVSAEVLLDALPILRDGGFDPKLGHEYAYHGSKLSMFIEEQHRLLQEKRDEIVRLNGEIALLKSRG